MVDEVIFIYNNPEDKDIVDSFTTSRPIAFDFLDYGSKLCKKKAWEYMEAWGARQLPMAVLKENNVVIKVLYTEDKNHVIESLKELI